MPCSADLETEVDGCRLLSQNRVNAVFSSGYANRASARMPSENLSRTVSRTVFRRSSAGHRLVVRHVLADRIEGARFLEGLDAGQKKAMEALEVLREPCLVENRAKGRRAPRWESFVQATRSHAGSTPVDFLGEPAQWKA